MLFPDKFPRPAGSCLSPYTLLAPVLFGSQARGARLLSSVLAMLLTIPVASTFAQSAGVAPAQRAEEGLRRQEERLREQLQQQTPKRDVLRPEASEALDTNLPEETPCFVIQEFKFTGEDAHRFSWLQNVVAPYRDRCIGVEGIRRIASLLDAKLVEWGYATTKTSLPAQNMRDGVLTFNIHVGRISAIRMVQAGTDVADDKWGTWRNAFPISAGDILNIRDLEQGAEQMQRLPSQAVRNRIEPGKAADTSVVVIERQSGSFSDRFRGGVTLDNSGTEPLGEKQFSGYASLDNPFGLNDIFSLNASSNTENLNSEHRSQSASLGYSIPFGYSTLSYNRSKSRYAQMVQGTTTRFLSSGSSSSDQVRLDHIALRDASAKFGIYAALSTRRAQSFLDDVELIVQKRRTTNFETGANYKKLIGDASFYLEIGYRRGMAWRDAQEDFGEDADGLTLRPKLWLFSASFSKPFTIAERPFQYSLSLSGQHTKDLTTSNDQFSIGNRYSVRGFDGESVLLAESGYSLRNEFATSFQFGENVGMQTYAGIDLGRVWGESAPLLIGTKLAGAVVGMRGQWKALQWDMAVATPLYKPEGFTTSNTNLYLSVTYGF